MRRASFQKKSKFVVPFLIAFAATALASATTISPKDAGDSVITASGNVVSTAPVYFVIEENRPLPIVNGLPESANDFDGVDAVDGESEDFRIAYSAAHAKGTLQTLDEGPALALPAPEIIRTFLLPSASAFASSRLPSGERAPPTQR